MRAVSRSQLSVPGLSSRAIIALFISPSVAKVCQPEPQVSLHLLHTLLAPSGSGSIWLGIPWQLHCRHVACRPASFPEPFTLLLISLSLTPSPSSRPEKGDGYGLHERASHRIMAECDAVFGRISRQNYFAQRAHFPITSSRRPRKPSKR